ncbi:MAG TPA: zinc-dependent alcohol dehydrogenase family protein [Rugosibacter sp.]
MARVVHFYQTGGPEVLQIEDETIGEPGAGEARIRIQSIGLNRAEAAFRSGTYIEQPVFPSRIGYEASGIIEALGDANSGFNAGDPVCILPEFSMTRYGVCAESAIVPSAALIKRPVELNEIESAAVWMPYMTAWGALSELAPFTASDAVIITAASSSVGLAAIQVAHRLGALPIAVTRTAEKRDALLASGAPHVIVSAEENIAERVMAITHGKGARMVFDPIAGPGVSDLAAALGPRGVFVIYGNLSGRGHETPFPYMQAMRKSLTMRPYLIFADMANKARHAAACEFILSGLKDKSLKPIIAKTFTLDQIVDAYQYLESNQQIGKVVVTVPR